MQLHSYKIYYNWECEKKPSSIRGVFAIISEQMKQIPLKSSNFTQETSDWIEDIVKSIGEGMSQVILIK